MTAQYELDHNKTGGILTTLPEGCERIRNWPVSKNIMGVRRLLGAIGFIRRYLKNFAEIRKHFSRPIGKAEIRRCIDEQLSFQILIEKCSEAIEIHIWSHLDPIKMHTDACVYRGYYVIT